MEQDVIDKISISNSLQADSIEKVLERNKKPSHIVEMVVGPSTITFSLSPGYGVKLSDVHSLSNDISRAVNAPSIRIFSIKEDDTIMIEVPRPDRETVYLEPLLKHQSVKNTNYILPMILGLNTHGDLNIIDLVDAPHLLIAGTTGSGKSVGLNSMLSSLILTQSPNNLKFIMIDPKVVEFAIYEKIGHLQEPMHTDPENAENALARCVEEMERRYQILRDYEITNISEYSRDDMPYLVIVIDELADLLQKDSSLSRHEKRIVEGCASHIRRITQKGRACGIHMIAATQRPTKDVIDGTIKSNFGTRISFLMADKINSNTILGRSGAEGLLGSGDFLYLSPVGIITRIQAPFISRSDLKRLLERSEGYGLTIFPQPCLDKNEPISEQIQDDYVYVLSNPSLSQNGQPLYKIGSSKDLEERVSKLSRVSSLPTPFSLTCYIKVDYAHQKEKEIHKTLKRFRVTTNREFFLAPIEQIVKVLEKYSEVKFPE